MKTIISYDQEVSFGNISRCLSGLEWIAFEIKVLFTGFKLKYSVKGKYVL